MAYFLATLVYSLAFLHFSKQEPQASPQSLRQDSKYLLACTGLGQFLLPSPRHGGHLEERAGRNLSLCVGIVLSSEPSR